jgi:phosphomethylpyrimidine synthase
MELTQQVRDYAKDHGLAEADALEAGMHEKSEQFRKNTQIYVKTGD